MKIRRPFLAWLAASALAVLLAVLTAPMYDRYASILHGGLVAALLLELLFMAIFVAFYQRASAAFGKGAKGGALFGLFFACAHCIANFQVPPTLGIPWGMAWLWTIWQFIYLPLCGAVIGAICKTRIARMGSGL